MSDIRLLKLITGEEIAGEVVNDTDDVLVLKNTVAIVLQPTKDGVTYGFVPWGNLTKEDKKISREKTIYDASASDELRNGYNSMFGGIVTPSKQLIT
jgi:hypothetical protein